jgi:broad specificity phosphatase PhoE
MNYKGTILPPLRNRYLALRHGHSEANEQSIIISDPEVGTRSYGLTATGREQVKTTLKATLKATLQSLPAELDTRTIIVSSDFLRARETAAIIAVGLKVMQPVRYSENLRERFFGELEGGADSRYSEVWQSDNLDPEHEDFGVESAVSVVQRATELVLELEDQYSDQRLLLVAHGDVLQLLQTAFAAISPAHHRQLPPLAVAELRQLIPPSPPSLSP